MKEYDRDSFWKIDKLVPPKKTPLTTFSTKEKVVDYAVGTEAVAASDERNRITVAPELAEEAKGNFTYEPASGLIKRVRVAHVPDKFDFHAKFVKAARLYFDFKGSECEFVPYYSYMPQYAQLTDAQKSFYFYWRSEARRGNFIKTDYSYLYLYVYEIINLPDLISPKSGIDMLISLWSAYRRALPNIDSNMALWVQDYCLAYGLECPMDKLREFVFSVIGTSQFKEFYLADAELLGPAGIASLIAYLSDYDWRCGKYAGGDNKEAYSKHLLGAMGLLLARLLHGGRIFSEAGVLATMDRTAFRGALTTSAVKYHVTAEYRPIAEEPELRAVVTSALKYTENKLRALLGVKSRLAVKDLPDEYKAIIDSYFADLFDKVNRERARASRPEYESHYEVTDTGFSSADADEIERASWQTTARLVEGVEEYEEEEEKDSAPPVAYDTSVDRYGLDDKRIDFIRYALEGDSEKMKKIASEIGDFPDSIAERINEVFADGFGDVILETDGENYTVIEDYREDISAWLLKITN